MLSLVLRSPVFPAEGGGNRMWAMPSFLSAPFSTSPARITGGNYQFRLRRRNARSGTLYFPPISRKVGFPTTSMKSFWAAYLSRKLPGSERSPGRSYVRRIRNFIAWCLLLSTPLRKIGSPLMEGSYLGVYPSDSHASATPPSLDHSYGCCY